MHYELNFIKRKDMPSAPGSLALMAHDAEELAYAEIVDMPQTDFTDPNKATTPNTRIEVYSKAPPFNSKKHRQWYALTAEGTPHASLTLSLALRFALLTSMMRAMTYVYNHPEAEYVHFKDKDTVAGLWDGAIYSYRIRVTGKAGAKPVIEIPPSKGSIAVEILPLCDGVYPYTAPTHTLLFASAELLEEHLGFGYAGDGWYQSDKIEDKVTYLIIKIPCMYHAFTPQQHASYTVCIWVNNDPFINFMALMALNTFVIPTSLKLPSREILAQRGVPPSHLYTEATLDTDDNTDDEDDDDDDDDDDDNDDDDNAKDSSFRGRGR